MSISCPSDEPAAADRQAFEQTGNPLHVGHAIAGFGRDEPLPLWVRDYILAAAHSVARVERAVLDGEISPQKAIEVLPRALGFVRQGKNMFQECRQLHEDSIVSARYHLEQFSAPGKPPKAIIEDLDSGVRSTIERKIAKVRRVIGWPQS